MNPLHADYYADRACFAAVEVIENVCTAEGTYRMRIAAPEIAQRITPGQFLMVRLADHNDPLLGRAFALYDVIRDAAGMATAVDFVYLKKGKLTTPLADYGPGRTIEVWGPLGNGFANLSCDHLIMVAGGIGQTPFLAVGKEALSVAGYGDSPRSVRAGKATLCYGVRTANLLAGAEDFRAAGIDLRIASDDGSVGRQGLVTELLREVLAESPAEATKQVVCCGPEPMMEAVAGVCEELGVPCQVSLETPMACGIGVCFSCVAKVKQDDGPGAEESWDYKRTCVEGPVFDAAKIAW